MNPAAKVIVQNGGTLIVNAGTIQNYTDGLLESIHTRKLPYRQNALQLPPLYTFYLHECTYDTYDRPIHQIYGNYYSVNYAYDSVRSWLTSKTTYNDSQSLQELQYSYDAVGNIIAIQQNADSVHWLGGQYMQEFQYDAQNRLRRADMISDYWGLYSNYNLTYSPSGMIGIKSCDDMLWNYWHGYCSANDKIINHQVRSIYDMENDATTFYQWDAAGRLQNIYIPCAGDIRHHRWSESGQLAATIDNEHCAFYTYDGNGNRAYKLTGNTMLDQYNAGQQFFHAYLNDAVVYVNPYFTISRKNYTRHIFNGTQRIATEIGTSDLSDCIDTTAAGMERLAYARAYMQSLFADPIELHSDTGTTFVDIDGDAYDELQWQCFGGDRLWQITIACDSDILLPILRRDNGAADTRVSGKYFYHTDHLGSANWVTKGDEAVQFIHYMPYGEMWYNQRGSAYNERYKFTGKERDEETGNDYFGARYYAAYTPMWLSPDPLMDKYPSISPYAYCNWNPMKYVDSDGKDAIYITFPQYKANGIPHTGHAGVLLINNQNGLTKYYEYGRYDKEKLGITRNLKIPDVKLKDGKPTPESLNKVLRSISKQAGHNGNIEGAYVKSDNFTKMDSYAKDKIQENNDPQRKPYNIITNNCATFAEDVILQDETIEKPWILIHTPINTVSEYQKNGNAKINYNSKTDDTSW